MSCNIAYQAYIQFCQCEQQFDKNETQSPTKDGKSLDEVFPIEIVNIGINWKYRYLYIVLNDKELSFNKLKYFERSTPHSAINAGSRTHYCLPIISIFV